MAEAEEQGGKVMWDKEGGIGRDKVILDFMLLHRYLEEQWNAIDSFNCFSDRTGFIFF